MLELLSIPIVAYIICIPFYYLYKITLEIIDLYRIIKNKGL